MVIAGDFNAHCSDWCASDQDDEKGKKINNTFLSYSLEQLVDFPTHLNSTGCGACLDLVITNEPHRFQKLHSLDSLGDSDHVIISWELICLLPLKPSQHYTDSQSEIADMLNDHFINVGERSSDTWNLPDLPPLPSSPPPLNAIPISSSIVYKSIKKLTKGKAPGIDGITNEILQKTSDSIAYPLSLLFHLCLSSGCYPTCWKHAVVTAIYKGKGKYNDPCNYRPISLLPTVSKLFERLVFDKLYTHVSPIYMICNPASVVVTLPHYISLTLFSIFSL